jgi:acyl CoA:acetate/3-ketoacid CoA transferase
VITHLFRDIPARRPGLLPPMEDGTRKIIARRAALELTPNSDSARTALYLRRGDESFLCQS